MLKSIGESICLNLKANQKPLFFDVSVRVRV